MAIPHASQDDQRRSIEAYKSLERPADLQKESAYGGIAAANSAASSLVQPAEGRGKVPLFCPLRFLVISGSSLSI